MSKLQRPRDGCKQCGAPIRTWKSGYGWWCWKCVREDRRAQQ